MGEASTLFRGHNTKNLYLYESYSFKNRPNG